MTPFTEKVIRIIKSIKKGNVMSYGQVAAQAGQPRSARQVARILHSMSVKHGLPWHRVVNSKWQIAVHGADAVIQKTLLESEGVLFKDERNIDTRKYRLPARAKNG